jgi:hypothetical protein
MATFGIMRSISVAITVCFIHPLMLVIVVLSGLIMVRIMNFVMKALNEVQLMDSTFRGPIHNSFDNVINGLVSLRTYERLDFFREGFIDQLE